MKHKLARFWEKYDGIILPVLVAMLTMWAGIMIGSKATLTDQALMCSQRVFELDQKISTRTANSASLIETNKVTAEAAKVSAEAAKKSASAAEKAAEKSATPDPLRTE